MVGLEEISASAQESLYAALSEPVSSRVEPGRTSETKAIETTDEFMSLEGLSPL